MKNILFVTFLLIFNSVAFAQDYIVLRKNEEEIKCRIIAINDTAIIYRKLKTEGSAKYSYKNTEILSYTLEKSVLRFKELSYQKGGLYAHVAVEQPNQRLIQTNHKVDPDEGMLGKYYNGEVTDGYLILNSGDTIRGLIFIENLAKNQINVRFMEDLGEEKEYNIAELKGYSYNNLTYNKVSGIYTEEIAEGTQSQNGDLFLHQLESGKAKLYLLFTISFSKSIIASYENPPLYYANISKYYVIENNDGKKLLIKGNAGLKRKLSSFFEKDPVLMQEINTKTPKVDDLPSIIKNYNSN